MIWHLIAALFAGLGAAGIGMLLRLLSGKRLPRWIIPVFAGLGLFAYQVHYEYSWFANKHQQLPESSLVVSTEQRGAFWRPWTYVFPMTTAFTIVDRDSMIVRNANGQPLVEFMLYRFERQYVDRVSHQAHAMNCSTRELVPLDGEPRQPRLSALRSLDASDVLYQTVCQTS